ncbi:MAG: DNA polymerase I [Bacteroidales bacterium]|nr:DNA polymerase I [Bacteroidales bacterium]
MKKLLLIDGMALVYRSYYALNHNPRLNSKGMNTSAVLGFATTLYDLMRQQNPSHIAVAFDLPKPTFRHEMYEQYKANREAMPEDIATALPYINKIIAAFNIPILTCEGYEADDVIGTISHKAEEEGFDQVLMVTPDKDFAQLVTSHVLMYRFGRMGKPDQVFGIAEVCEKFGVSDCRQVIDLLGLWGDASDNIPGIPGVGEKSAKKLIDQFGSIEAMVQNSDEIKNDKMRSLVQQYGDQALFSKKLATISLDAPIPFDEQALQREKPDYRQLKSLFDDLEFRAFSKRIYTDLSLSDPDSAMLFSKAAAKAVESVKASPQLSIFDIQPDSDAESNDAAVVSNISEITEEKEMPADCDVSIIIQGPVITLSTNAESAYTVQVDKVDIGALKRLLENPNTIKLCYDLKSLKYILRELGIEISGMIFDCQLVHYLIDSEARHTFDFICNSVIGVEPESQQQSVAAMWLIYPRLSSQLGNADLSRLYYEVELPLVDVLISMEQEGVRIDVSALREYSQNLTAQRDAIEQEVYSMAGERFNINSPKQLGEVLYEHMKITDKPPRTATKQYSTAEDVLQKLKKAHPVVEKILEYRSISKLLGTYLDSFPKLINPETGRLHTIYNQTVTATGRLSSSSPNLQNIPIRTERGREIRRAFVPRNDDYVLLAADYSQIELRIIASLANDRHMIEAFSNGLDIHAATAAKIYKVPIEEVTKDQRRNAKSVNFGIVYGISAFGLSEQLGIPRKEAAALIDEYFAQYPDIKAFIEKNIAFAREYGYARTMLGRRRNLADINSRNNSLRSFAERNAVNMPIQGTSADMIKIAMNRIFARFIEKGLRSRMILQVHDEVVIDVFKPELDEVKEIVRKEMIEALPLSIPIDVGLEIGQNWLEAH